MQETRGGLLPGLHGLRAAAALAVCAFHLHGYAGLQVPAFLPWAGTHFGRGVHLFFALSAFSLAWANPDAATQLRAYLVKRFFRIAPLYWLLVLLVLAFRPWPGAARALAEFAFVFNFVPEWMPGLVPAGWTVGVEMPFYVCLPLLLQIRRLRWLVAAAVVATAVSVFARMLVKALYPEDPLLASMTLAGNAWVFIWALVAFRIFRDARGMGREGPVAAGAAALAGVLVIGMLSPAGTMLRGDGDLDLMVMGIGFAALCTWQALRPSWLLRGRAALWLGERSYSIYLAHIPVIVGMRPVFARIVETFGQGGPAFIASFCVALPVVCLLAELGYRLVERPGMAAGRWVIRRWRLDAPRGAAA